MFTITVSHPLEGIVLKETHTNYLFAEQRLTEWAEAQGWKVQTQDPLGSFAVYHVNGPHPGVTAKITW